ncbi:MAG: J domain-containing protein [Deltaproteobacteria bacterium]|jgi:curved DNA-binding protein CbpA|nr:J domain-containing protein [Deltaproteobacteria bacterium]
MPNNPLTTAPIEPKNPFEILGLTPDLVGELSEKQLKLVIKAMYRSLQKNFHPDVVKPKKNQPEDLFVQKTVELNLAYESLNFERDPESFRKHRKNYLSRRPEALYQNTIYLKQQLEAQLEKEDRLANNFFNFLASNGSNGANGANGSNGSKSPNGSNGAKGANGSSISSFKEAPKRLSAPITAKNIRLGLMDVAINHNLARSRTLQGHDFKNYKLIEIDAEGLMSVRPVGRSNAFRSDYIQLLGCVPDSALEVVPLLTPANPLKEFKSQTVIARKHQFLPFSVVNNITLANFKRYVLPLLNPTLLERSYLFSLNKTDYQRTGLISLEGLIIKFENL